MTLHKSFVAFAVSLEGSVLPRLMAALRGDLPEREEEWEGIFTLASESLTIGTLAQRLLNSPRSGELSADVVQFLHTIQSRVEERNRRTDRQLEEALCVLNRSGLKPALIKGVALRVLQPVEASGRILSDLDLVLPPSAKREAVQALQQIGYSLRDPLDESARPVVVYRAQDVGMIDLQFAFRASGIGYDYDDVAASSHSVRIGNATALLPDASIQAALLVLHDQIKDQDYWRGLIDLRHLLDIEMLADQINWHRLSDQFRGAYAQAALQTQLVALNRLLGVNVPAPLVRGAWPRLQHWRRLAQLRMPRSIGLFSYLTIATDLLAGRISRGGPSHAPPRTDAGKTISSPQTGGSGHLLRAKAVGKV